MLSIGKSDESSILNSIFKEAKKLSATQEMAIKQMLSKETPNDAFGKFVRDLLFDNSTVLDYEIVAKKMRKHFPELTKEIEAALN